jgi:iron-sulfur cluster assembly accessory protein
LQAPRCAIVALSRVGDGADRPDEVCVVDVIGASAPTTGSIGMNTPVRLVGVKMTETLETTTHGVFLTDVAVAKVRSLLDQEGRDDLRLRVAVQPGGCSGLIYQLYFDDRTLDGDAIADFEGVEVVVDRMSVPYLEGATVDFADTIEKQGFTIDNPNASSSCACGGSFA